MGAGAHGGWGDLKANKLNCHLSEGELFGVQSDVISAAGVKPLNCLEESFLDGARPHQGVIYAFGLPWDIGHDLIGGNVPLWGNTVAVAAPRCDELQTII